MIASSGEQSRGSYGHRVIDHFEHPRKVGVAADFNRRFLEQDNPWLLRILITLRVEGGNIREARFKAQSCVTTTASLSVLMEMVEGRTEAEALAITPEQLSESLGIVPPEKMYCCQLAIATFRRALGTPVQPAAADLSQSSNQGAHE